MFSYRLAAALAAPLLLAACAGSPAKTTKADKADKAAAATAAVDETEIGTLYTRLGEAVKRYEGSADLAAAGERELAAREGNAALDDLRAAALRCQQLPGCEEERFLSAFDGLLRRDAPVTAEAEPKEPARTLVSNADNIKAMLEHQRHTPIRARRSSSVIIGVST